MIDVPEAAQKPARKGRLWPPIMRTGNLGDFGDGIFRGFGAALITRGNPAAYLLLTIVCLIAFGIGLAALPATDRDESRFMQATKQMVETGDYIHIRVQSEPRRKKPIGIHWLQVAAVKALHQPLTTAWPYRMPSALAALAAVLLTCAAGRRMFTPRAGLIAGAMIATSPLVVAEAHLAKTDAALLGFVTLAMTALARLYVHPSAPRPDMVVGPGSKRSEIATVAVFWLAVGAAILIKGPVVLLVAVATIATLCVVDHSTAILRTLRLWWGIPLAALIVAPWAIALFATGDSGFFAQAVRQDLLPKLAGGQESHGLPPGSHLVATLFTAWPWSFLLPVALATIWRRRHDPAVRYCFAWLVPGWLAFEAIPTKLPHYILPLLPAGALLLGAAMDNTAHVQTLLRSRGGAAWRWAWGLVTLGLGFAILLVAVRFGAPGGVADNPWAVAATATAVAVAAAAVIVGDRVGSGMSFAALALFAVVFDSLLMARVVPSLENLWVSQRLAAAVARYPSPQPASLVGFHEPSAVFLLGTATHLTDAAGASADLIGHPGTLAAVDASDLPAVTAAVEHAGLTAVTLETIQGQDYARSTGINLTLITAARP